MLRPFQTERVIQAAAVLLKATNPPRMSRLRLLKLLYIADRESILARGRTITGDAVVAMDHGPVLSRVYDCIKGIDPIYAEWERFISRSGPQDLQLKKDPGVGALTHWEADKLAEVTERYQHLHDYALARITHEFAEYKKNYREGTASIIPVFDVLEAVGLGADADSIIQEAESYAQAQRLVASVR